MSLRWSEEEIKVLRRYYSLKSFDGLKALLNRSEDSIKIKGNRIGLKRPSSDSFRRFSADKWWTEEQIKILKDNYGSRTTEELSLMLGRPKDSILQKGPKLGLNRKHNTFPRRWSDDDYAFLLANKDLMTGKELAEKMNTTQGTIYAMLNYLGLKKKSFSSRAFFKKGMSASVSTEFQSPKLSKKQILKLYPGMRLERVAKKLHVSFKTLKKYMLRYNIPSLVKGSWSKGKPHPVAKERMFRLWSTGYFKDMYPFPAPNKKEALLLNVIGELELPYRFVGDWQFTVGTKCPDFVHTTKNKAIELFGDYWHSPAFKRKNSEYSSPEARTKYFNERGFELLVLWEKDLKNIDYVRERLLAYENA